MKSAQYLRGLRGYFFFAAFLHKFISAISIANSGRPLEVANTVIGGIDQEVIVGTDLAYGTSRTTVLHKLARRGLPINFKGNFHCSEGCNNTSTAVKGDLPTLQNLESLGVVQIGHIVARIANENVASSGPGSVALGVLDQLPDKSIRLAKDD